MPTQRQFFLQHLAQTSDAPLALEIVKGDGVYLYDVDGKKYLDLIAGISVSTLGHCHPEVVKAVKNQAEMYMHTMVYGEYILQPQVALASYLSSLLPPCLSSVYITNSGAEATEGAMKLAKRYTGRKEFVACRNAYHGSTQGALSLMSDNYFKQAFEPLLPNISYIDYNNLDDVFSITENTAAVFIEPLQAESGATTINPDFLKAIADRCKKVGALLVLDEIQTGCGRLGTMWAFEQYDIVPDILLLAKALGGGMPIGAFISSNTIMHSLSNNPVLGHITTFGGNPVCCAAALATLKVLQNSDYISLVNSKESLFRSLLIHPKIKKITGKGLLLAIHLENAEEVQKIIKSCIKKGIISDWFLFAPHCVRIAPPLIISNEEITWVCQELIGILNR
jgi:acetylornithine/N-succinyldiaminopimelate aminotransferase